MICFALQIIFYSFIWFHMTFHSDKFIVYYSILYWITYIKFHYFPFYFAMLFYMLWKGFHTESSCLWHRYTPSAFGVCPNSWIVYSGKHEASFLATWPPNLQIIKGVDVSGLGCGSCRGICTCRCKKRPQNQGMTVNFSRFGLYLCWKKNGWRPQTSPR